MNVNGVVVAFSVATHIQTSIERKREERKDRNHRHTDRGTASQAQTQTQTLTHIHTVRLRLIDPALMHGVSGRRWKHGLFHEFLLAIRRFDARRVVKIALNDLGFISLGEKERIHHCFRHHLIFYYGVLHGPESAIQGELACHSDLWKWLEGSRKPKREISNIVSQ